MINKGDLVYIPSNTNYVRPSEGPETVNLIRKTDSSSCGYILDELESGTKVVLDYGNTNKKYIAESSLCEIEEEKYARTKNH